MKRISSWWWIGGVLFAAVAAAPRDGALTAQRGGGSGPASNEWRTYGADLASTRYSPLDQINKDNFSKLRIAWRLSTNAFGPRPDSLYSTTPLFVDGVLYARPLVAFARALDGDAPLLGYPRFARRADGIDVHAPELDGVSGATLWRVQEGGGAGVDCVLHAGGVQVAFKPGAYARGAPFGALRELAERFAH